MDCKTINSKLYLFVENKLSNEERQDVKKHLAECLFCSAIVHRLKTAYQIIEKERNTQSNPFLYTRMMAEIEKRKAEIAETLPLYQKVLRPVFISAFVALGLYIGISLGNYFHTNTITSSNEQISETVFVDDIAVENIENLVSE